MINSPRLVLARVDEAGRSPDLLAAHLLLSQLDSFGLSLKRYSNSFAIWSVGGVGGAGKSNILVYEEGGSLGAGEDRGVGVEV